VIIPQAIRSISHSLNPFALYDFLLVLPLSHLHYNGDLLPNCEKGFGIRGAYIEASMAGKERIIKDENRGAY
jgi:hypothetical protein